MARPREFDEAIALEAIMRQFWSHGYEGTSTRELATAAGITIASLYNAFGDKKATYRRALDHYIATSFVDRVGRFERLPPRKAITSFFSEIIQRSLEDADRKGCMLVNSAMEVAPHDPEFQRVVTNVLFEIEGFFTRCAQRGQDAGIITKKQTAEDIGRLLLGTHVGLRVLARVRPERALLEGMVNTAYVALDD